MLVVIVVALASPILAAPDAKCQVQSIIDAGPGKSGYGGQQSSHNDHS
jgi:hypothetical protein